MDFKTDALCVRAEDYGDNDKILTLLTTDRGKISAKVRGIKSPKSKLRAAASPLAFGEYTLIEKNGRNSVTGAAVQEGFYNCWKDLDRYSASQIVLELADKATYGEGSVAEELVLTLRALSEINYGEHTPYVVVVWYFIKLMPVIGEDYHDENELPKEVMSGFEAVNSAEVGDLDSLDFSPSALYKMLYYADLIIKRVLGGSLNAFSEAFKLLLK